jgi:hypothetical protein
MTSTFLFTVAGNVEDMTRVGPEYPASGLNCGGAGGPGGGFRIGVVKLCRFCGFGAGLVGEN